MGMSRSEVRKALAGVVCPSSPSANDGDIIHIWYKSFGKHSKRSEEEAARAANMGLPGDHYTGRLVSIREDSKGDMLVTMRVELERPNVFRSFNVNKGEVLSIFVFGRKEEKHVEGSVCG